MCLVDVVVRRYTDFLILLIPTPLVFALFGSSSPTFCSFFIMFFVLVPVHFCNLFNNFFVQYKQNIRATTGVPRKPFEGLDIMFYTRRSTNKHTLHILRWTSAIRLQGAW